MRCLVCHEEETVALEFTAEVADLMTGVFKVRIRDDHLEDSAELLLDFLLYQLNKMGL